MQPRSGSKRSHAVNWRSMEDALRFENVWGSLPLTWIEQNLFADLPLPVLAQHAAMSVRTLSRHFRAQVGITPAEWIARARVRRAERLLETTSLDVEHVAADCGFGSASIAAPAFHRHRRCQPSGLPSRVFNYSTPTAREIRSRIMHNDRRICTDARSFAHRASNGASVGPNVELCVNAMNR